MNEILIAVPRFPRLEEYAGVWAYEPIRFDAQFRLLTRTDLAAHMAAGQAPRTSSLQLVKAKGGKSVAVISAIGTLMKQQSSMGGTSTIQLRRDIRMAANDPDVSGILLAIDSPGGTVSGTADLAAEVRAARKKMPVFAHIDDLGASAAYWVASQASSVYANTGTALIGSIGTFMVAVDASEAAAKEGVKVLVFKTGPLKGAGITGSPITDEQAANWQKQVDAQQAEFDAAVKSGRALTTSELAAVRTGEVFTARAAQERKLIDGVRSLDSTLAALIQAT
jgi:signal peptide peptidase SppA